MTIVDSNSSNFSWELVTKKTFSKVFLNDPEKNIQTLTNTVSDTILNESWCKEHNIHNTKHRNRLICKVISDIGNTSIPKKLISLFFKSLSNPQHNLFPLKNPLFIPMYYQKYESYSKSDLNVALGEVFAKTLKKHHDVLANEIIKTAGNAHIRLLALTVKNNCFKTLETLIKKHQYSTKDLSNCLGEACECKSPESLTLLLKYGANPNTPCMLYSSAIHVAASNDNPEILKTIFDQSKFPINFDLLQGGLHSPLGLVYQDEKEENYDYLLSKMSSPNTLDCHGLAPIHYTCTFFCNDEFNPKALNILLNEHNANVNLPNSNGRIPIELALNNIWHVMGPTIDILLKAGADITIPSKNKKPIVINCIDNGLIKHITPLFAAFPNIVSLLKKDKKDSSDFINQIKNDIDHYLDTDDSTASPLDLVVLLQDPELKSIIRQALSQSEFNDSYEKTLKKYPGCRID